MSPPIPLLTCTCPSCIRRKRQRGETIAVGVSAVEVTEETIADGSSASGGTAPNIALLSGFAAMPIIIGVGYLATFLH